MTNLQNGINFAVTEIESPERTLAHYRLQYLAEKQRISNKCKHHQ